MTGEGSGIRLYRFIIAFSFNLLKTKWSAEKQCLLVSLSPLTKVMHYIISRLTSLSQQTNKEIPDPAFDLKMIWSSEMAAFQI